MLQSLRVLAWWSLLAGSINFGCSGTQTGQGPARELAAAPSAGNTALPARGAAPSALVPVTDADAQWGDPAAPVTIVVFSDFECPFCARAAVTLREIQNAHASRVRIVFKHNPLPFHRRARPAAIAAQTVFALGGRDAFWKFHDSALTNSNSLEDESFVTWAAAAGVDAAAFRHAYAQGTYAAKVDADMALAAELGATGTPAFRINGVELRGAQPFAEFERVIQEQLEAARKLVASGVAAMDVYATLTNRNLRLPPPPEAASPPAAPVEDDSVWNVPVWSDDPVRGPKDAPVTIVVFSDFQCPFCKRGNETLTQVMELYAGRVRLVWKDLPLDFHPRARPAAALARYAYAQKGEKAFWTAHDELFDSQPNLDDADLARIASKLGVRWDTFQKKLSAGAFDERLERSADLADELEARGTPHFFINGVRVAGAQPPEVFKKRIDDALARADALRESGISKAPSYEELIQDGKTPPPPATKQPPVVEARSPFRGPANAPVIIQAWSDYQCRFCLVADRALSELEKEFGSQIKIVHRHLPLPMHDHAALASEAAEEAFRQRGNAGFWRFHTRIFDLQSQPGSLSREGLERVAAEQGLDATEFQHALNSRRHAQTVAADAELARRIGIDGTPGILINHYYVAGAQPRVFRKLIRRALAESKRP